MPSRAGHLTVASRAVAFLCTIPLIITSADEIGEGTVFGRDRLSGWMSVCLSGRYLKNGNS